MGAQVRVEDGHGHGFIIAESEIAAFVAHNPGAIVPEVEATPALEAPRRRGGRPPRTMGTPPVVAS